MANVTRTATDRGNAGSPVFDNSVRSSLIAALTRSGQAGYTLNVSVDWRQNTLPERRVVPRNDPILTCEQHNMER
jgi:hypothetical protein